MPSARHGSVRRGDCTLNVDDQKPCRLLDTESGSLGVGHDAFALAPPPPTLTYYVP